VFLIQGTQVTDLSGFGSGMNRFFVEHLPFMINNNFPDVNIDNHFKGIGLHGVYDAVYDRVIITKLDYAPKSNNILYDPVEQEFYINNVVNGLTIRQYINVSDEQYFCNVSWTLSFNMNTKSWISFHSYIPNWYVAENNFFYSGQNNCCEDFDFLVGVLVPNPSTTTTTSTSTSSTTTTTTTVAPLQCNITATVQQIDCSLAGVGVIVSLDCILVGPTTSTTSTSTTSTSTTSTTSTSTTTSTTSSTTTTTTTAEPTTTTTTTTGEPTTTTTTSTSSTTTTTTTSSPYCYVIESVQSAPGECFDCPGFFGSTTDTTITFYDECGGNIIPAPFDINVTAHYSDSSTGSTFIPAGFLGIAYIAFSDVQCVPFPVCGEDASPTFDYADVIPVTGTISECCLPPITTTTTTTTLTPTTTTTTSSTTTTTTTISVNCGEGSSYSGGVSYPTTESVTLGTDTGTVVLDYNAQNVPDRFIVQWNSSVVIDTGYRGAPQYDFGGGSRSAFTSSLTGDIDPITLNTYPDFATYPDDGYPRIVGPGIGTASFNKNLGTDTFAIIKVYAPMSGTVWSYQMNCPLTTTTTTSTTTTTTTTQIPSECYILSSAPFGGCTFVYKNENGVTITYNIPSQDEGLCFTACVTEVISDDCGFFAQGVDCNDPQCDCSPGPS
jgi:hypothetical protein